MIETDSERGGLIVGLNIEYRRRPPFMYMTAFNPDLTDIVMGNTNVVRVHNHRMGYYIGMYATKSKKEHATSLSGLVLAGTRYLDWYRRRHEPHGTAALAASSGAAADEKAMLPPGPAAPLSAPAPPSPGIDAFARYLGTMRASIRGHTDGEVIGAQIAAWLLTGGDLYITSHTFAAIAPKVALNYFRTGEVSGRLLRQGQVRCAMLHYLYRPPALEQLSWWEFVTQTRRVRIKKRRRRRGTGSDGEDGDDHSENDDEPNGELNDEPNDEHNAERNDKGDGEASESELGAGSAAESLGDSQSSSASAASSGTASSLHSQHHLVDAGMRL
jgi:hypothetical protein